MKKKKKEERVSSKATKEWEIITVLNTKGILNLNTIYVCMYFVGSCTLTLTTTQPL